MNDILKQRLVGALILVALGVVFWPIIFVEPGGGAAGDHAGIPERPAVDTSPVETPDLAGLRPSKPLAAVPEEAPAPAPTPVEQPQSDTRPVEPVAEPVTTKPKPASKTSPAPQEKPRTRSEAPEKPAIDSDGVPIAWILQVASVSSAAKADELRKQLLAFDQKAYVKKIKRGDKVLYRVYIGPRFERAALENMQSRINTQFGVSSMIARYYP